MGLQEVDLQVMDCLNVKFKEMDYQEMECQDHQVMYSSNMMKC